MDFRESTLSDILNTLKDLRDIKNKDKSYMNVIKQTLKNLYIFSKENNIEDIYLELKEIENALFQKVEVDDKIILMKFDFIEKALEEKLLQKRKVVIFSEYSEKLNELIERLAEIGIDTILGKDDILNIMMEHYPNAVILQSNKDINALTILDALRKEEILHKIPVIIIGEDDTDVKIKSLELGAIDYINYPFDINEVILKISNLSIMSYEWSKNSVYDVATGLYAKNYGEALCDKFLLNLRKQNKTGVLLLIDFDHISEINKKMGISFGNAIIKEVISQIKRYITKADVASRISKNEFAILFYDKNIKWVKNTVEEVLKYTKEYGKKFKVDVSFSWSIVLLNNETKDFKEAYFKAKQSLNNARADGQEMVIVDIEPLKENDVKNILFLDDDKIILSILTARYKNKGYNVYSASDGVEALEIVKKNKIDLIVTDYYMKLMNGDELIKKIKEQNKNIKIIVLSSQKSEDYVKMAFEIGADDYIVKPFSPVELDSRIKRLLSD